MSEPIIIVGGGPTGLMLASELGLAGVRAIVLDSGETLETPQNLRSHVLHARAVELLEWRGLMDLVRDEERPVWPFIHYSNIWLDLAPLIDSEYSLAVPQKRLVEVLLARAEELGADIRRGHRVIGLEQDDAGVTVRVHDGQGERQLRASYVVGCDGEDSAVRGLAGFSAPPSGASWYGVLADFEQFEGQWESLTYPTGLFAVLPHPIKPGWARLMSMEFDADVPGADVPVTIEELQAVAQRITGQNRTFDTPSWVYRYTNRTRLADSYRQGRVFLAGDAAHVHYFAAGHGLSTSLHDAANLGWKLGAVLAGEAPASLLDSYQDERHPVGRRAARTTQAQLALLHPPERVPPLRELFEELVKFPDVNRHLITLVTDVRYSFPPPDPADDAPAHPLLGRTVRDASVIPAADGQPSLASVLRSGGAAVVDLTGDGRADLGDRPGWGDRVAVVTGSVAEPTDAKTLLVRPDGFIAWVDTTGKDADGLRAAITRWLGDPK